MLSNIIMHQASFFIRLLSLTFCIAFYDKIKLALNPMSVCRVVCLYQDVLFTGVETEAWHSTEQRYNLKNTAG